jgi:hypothetical protein
MQPKVRGYTQVEYKGSRTRYKNLIRPLDVLSRDVMINIARSDYFYTGIKSVFRPVYTSP